MLCLTVLGRPSCSPRLHEDTDINDMIDFKKDLIACIKECTSISQEVKDIIIKYIILEDAEGVVEATIRAFGR